VITPVANGTVEPLFVLPSMELMAIQPPCNNVTSPPFTIECLLKFWYAAGCRSTNLSMADRETLRSFSNAELEEVLVTFNLVYSRCVRRRRLGLIFAYSSRSQPARQ
jgi:hypothetical protein